MNAIFVLMTWLMSLSSPTAPATYNDVIIEGQTTVDLNGGTIITTSPRTVVALEDTHFRPSK